MIVQLIISTFSPPEIIETYSKQIQNRWTDDTCILQISDLCVVEETLKKYL